MRPLFPIEQAATPRSILRSRKLGVLWRMTNGFIHPWVSLDDLRQLLISNGYQLSMCMLEGILDSSVICNLTFSANPTSIIINFLFEQQE